MRRGLSLLWLGATAVVSAVVGVISYQAGWAAGAAAKLPAGAGVPYYYGPHFLGFFGSLPLLFLVLLLLFVVRAGRGRRPWGGAWGPRGYSPFASTAPQPGPVQPPPADDPWVEQRQGPPAERPAPPEQR